MDEQQLFKLFPNASRSTVAANRAHRDPAHPKHEERTGQKAGDDDLGSAKLERHAQHGSLGARKAKKGDTKRFLVRVTCVRKRLLDADNLAAKWIIDCTRYASIVPGDSPATTEIETTQRKAEKGESEYTVVEIFEIGEN